MHLSWLLIYITIAWILRVTTIPIVLRRRFAPGASIAWLGIVFLHPYIGVTLYLLFGETRLGPARLQLRRALTEQFRSARPEPNAEHRATRDAIDPAYSAMVLQAEKISGLPVLTHNAIDFLPEVVPMVDRLIADIDAATSHVHLLYYLFANDATGRRVAEALERAAARGVKCRVLADAVASRAFLHRDGLSHRLRSAGVSVAAALPVHIIQRHVPRMDLRNHRKLAIVDDRFAYMGSHNLIDADYGGRRGAPWVDASARLAGPIVAELGVVFAEDWAFETGETLAVPSPNDLAAAGDAAMQAVPTGPSFPGDTYRRLLLAAVGAARSRIVLTTPYFVPDEPTLVSLMMAADRGVDVHLLLPKTPDHLFTAAAGRASYESLLEAGVSISLYRPGLLHAKTLTVDNAFALFGSANLDVRSFNLNFEISLVLYGPEVTQRLRDLQMLYLKDCDRLDLKQWSARPAWTRYADSAIALLSPLL